MAGTDREPISERPRRLPARGSSPVNGTMHARDRLAHRDALRLPCLDARQATLDLGGPGILGPWVDVRVEARGELLGKLATILIREGHGVDEHVLSGFAHASKVAPGRDRRESRSWGGPATATGPSGAAVRVTSPVTSPPRGPWHHRAVQHIDELPDDATIADVQYRQHVIDAVNRGRDEIAGGTGIPHPQVAAELRAKWSRDRPR